jgi:nucleolar GTP-binding protein
MAQSSGSFKSIEPVPSGSDFLDIVLSRTQRRLPTVIRPGFKISRIRSFYSRKVKYTQESFTEKLDGILTQFPRLDTVHPFHADLVCLLKETRA